MKILGIVLILWGVADIGLNLALDIDVYYSLGIQLPETIWLYSHFISIAIGFGLYQLGDKLQK